MRSLAPLCLALVLLLPLAAPAPVETLIARPWLDPVLFARPPDEPALLLLGFSAPPDAAALAWLREEGVLASAYAHLPVALGLGAPERAAALPARHGLVSVAADVPIERHALPAGEPGNAGGTGDTITRADAARALGYTGRGVAIASIDLGVSSYHPSLAPRDLGGPLVQNVKVVVSPGRVMGNQPAEAPLTAYVENLTDTDTADGHGTHVASIAAGAWTPDGLLGGRAPGADLVALAAGDALALPWVLGALEWVLAHREEYNIRIVTNSWGVQGPYQPLHPVNLATRALDEAGVLVVFSAGNNGPGLRTLNAYAQAPHVLAVGSTTMSGAVAHSSSRGDAHSGKPGPDLVAPGSNVVGARNKPLSANDITFRTPWTDAAHVPTEHLAWWRAVSGTSMAAPQVAGIAALVLEADPDLTPAELRALLAQAARPIVGFEREAQGAGLVDAEAAVRAARGEAMPSRDWVRPTVEITQGYTRTHPFHGAIVGGPEKSSEAFRPRHAFPVHLPAGALTLDYGWSTLPGAASPAGHVLSLLAPDGTLAWRETLEGSAGNVTLALDAAALDARRDPAWSAAYWSLVVDLDAGALSYRLDARIAYATAALPDVTHVPPPPPAPPAPRMPRAAIRIETDADFTEQNGVTGGSGRAGDPFVIEGWEIVGASSTPLQIGGRLGTTAHVVVRNVRVADTRADCIMLQNARHVSVTDSVFEGCAGAFLLLQVEDARIERNLFRGVGRGPSVYGASGLAIMENRIEDARDWGILLSQGVTQGGGATLGVEVARNALAGETSRLVVTTPAASRAEIHDNTFEAGAWLSFESASGGHRASGSRWLDGQPRIHDRAGTAASPAPYPNTVVDAGSDRYVRAGEPVCLHDARASRGAGDARLDLSWDLGPAGVVEEEHPCATFPAPGRYQATLRVLYEDVEGRTFVLMDDADITVA